MPTLQRSPRTEIPMIVSTMRLIEAAEAVGANAILAMPFDSDEVGTR